MEGVLWKWTNYWNGTNLAKLVNFFMILLYNMLWCNWLLFLLQVGKPDGLFWRTEFYHTTSRKKKLIRGAKAQWKYQYVRSMVMTVNDYLFVCGVEFQICAVWNKICTKLSNYNVFGLITYSLVNAQYLFWAIAYYHR